MVQRTKYTLRLDAGFSSLLKKHYQDSGFHSMNAYILHLINLALNEDVKTIQDLKDNNHRLNEVLKTKEVERENLYKKYQELISLEKARLDLQRKVEQLIQHK